MALVGGCRSLELRCTCDLLRAYLPMTRNTSATSIKHDHLLRWGGQMYYPEKACNDNYVRRRETPSLSVVRQHSRVRHEMTDTMGELPGNYESRLVISACSGVSLVPSAWFRCFLWRDCESNHPFPVEGEQSQPPARKRTAEYTFKDPEPARRQRRHLGGFRALKKTTEAPYTLPK